MPSAARVEKIGLPSREPPAPAAKPTNKPPCFRLCTGAALLRQLCRRSTPKRSALRGPASLCEADGLRPWQRLRRVLGGRRVKKVLRKHRFAEGDPVPKNRPKAVNLSSAKPAKAASRRKPTQTRKSPRLNQGLLFLLNILNLLSDFFNLALHVHNNTGYPQILAF